MRLFDGFISSCAIEFVSIERVPTNQIHRLIHLNLFPFPLITARISDSLEVHRTCPQCLTILYMTPQERVVTDLNLETLFHSQLHSESTGIAQRLLPPSRQAPFFESKNLYSFCRNNNLNYIRLGS